MEDTPQHEQTGSLKLEDRVLLALESAQTLHASGKAVGILAVRHQYCNVGRSGGQEGGGGGSMLMIDTCSWRDSLCTTASCCTRKSRTCCQLQKVGDRPQRVCGSTCQRFQLPPGPRLCLQLCHSSLWWATCSRCVSTSRSSCSTLPPHRAWECRRRWQLSWELGHVSLGHLAASQSPYREPRVFG